MSEVKHLNEENFSAETAEGIVLVDFWAEWCGPCRMLAPVLDSVADEIEIVKVNVDDLPQLAVAFQGVSIPTIIVMKNGEIANKAVGYMPKAEILKLL